MNVNNVSKFNNANINVITINESKITEYIKYPRLANSVINLLSTTMNSMLSFFNLLIAFLKFFFDSTELSHSVRINLFFSIMFLNLTVPPHEI